MSWLDRRLRDLSGSSWYQGRLCWDGLEVVSEENVALRFCLVEFEGYGSQLSKWRIRTVYRVRDEF